MLVAEVMTKNVKTIRADSDLRAAAKIMCHSKIGALIVISGKGIPEGMITERMILEEISCNDKSLSTKLEEVMISKEKVIAIPPQASLEDASELMLKNKIKRLPVIEQGKLVGIVTTTDLIKYEGALVEQVSQILSSRKTAGIAG